MNLTIVLSAFVGAMIFFAGWYTGHTLDRGKTQEMPGKKLRKSHPPKCWVVLPGEPDEERKKTRKKRSISGSAATAGFDESKIKGTDVSV